MKRFLMLVAVVILCVSWASPAQAQLGIGGIGGESDPLGQIEAARSEAKLRKQQYSKVKPKAGKGQAARSSVSSYNTNSLDRFGRMDLAGHAVGGYPVVRGNLESTKVSRGGANGKGGRGGGRRSR